LFAQLAARFTTDNINGGATGDLIEPGSEDGVGLQLRGIPGKIGEGGLGDLLGKLRRTDLPERGRMDEIKVAADDFGEGVFRVVAGVTREQLQVAVGRGSAHFLKYIAACRTFPTNYYCQREANQGVEGGR
jgi:hypothetical protein